MQLRDQIFQLLSAKDYVPMRRDQICATLKLGPEDTTEANRLIDAMLESGEIARLKKDRLCIPSDADLVHGRILFRQSGAATLIPQDKPKTPVAEGYPVAAEDTGVALHGDHVLARINQTPQRPQRSKKKKAAPGPEQKPNVRVIRILKRARDSITGTLDKGRHATFVIPDDPRIIQDILVPDPANSGLRPRPKKGDKVVVKLIEWRQRHLNPEGEIIEVLGQTHEPDAEFKAILHKYELDPAFPPEVRKQTENIPDHVRASDIRNRRDLRDIFTFTIDPDDAQDFDDALYVEPLKQGNIRVGVHIADVSAYVKPGSPLDIEAQRRGNSTYLVGTVIPMLPHALSNGLCSLVEGEDRLTKSALITFSPKAEILDVEFANSVIRSNKRLTYNQAHAFLREDDFDRIRNTPLPPPHQTGATGRPLTELGDREIATIRDHLKKLWNVASRLRKKRFREGSLDLDMTEVKIYVDEEGYADRIEKQVHDESHQLIEEFMLAANEQIARLLKQNHFPALYRVHDEPEDEKLQELRETMLTFGVPCGNLTKTREMISLLKKLKGHPQGYTLKVHVLRSLKQAQYRASADGHFGLGKDDYAHFTSPIRRYADLVIHRVLDTYLHKTGADSAADSPDVQYTQAKLESLGEHLSVTERNSVDAERESIKTKLLEFYERELKKDRRQNFEAIITDVKNHGLFIELTDSLAFGLVHISTLDDDFYHMDSDGTALVGRRKRKTYMLGQKIQVQVDRVDRFKRQIDFRVAADDELRRPLPDDSEPPEKTVRQQTPKRPKKKSGKKSASATKRAQKNRRTKSTATKDGPAAAGTTDKEAKTEAAAGGRKSGRNRSRSRNRRRSRSSQ